MVDARPVSCLLRIYMAGPSQQARGDRLTQIPCYAIRRMDNSSEDADLSEAAK